MGSLQRQQKILIISKYTLHVCNNEQMRSLIHKIPYSKHYSIEYILSLLSLAVAVSLTHQRISVVQFSNRRSFNCFHLTYARRYHCWSMMWSMQPSSHCQF